MTKITAAHIQIACDTLNHSLEFANWTGSFKDEVRKHARDALQELLYRTPVKIDLEKSQNIKDEV